MIAYFDSSAIARAYLVDEPGHDEAAALLEDEQLARITGTWSRIEVTGTLIRAARAGRVGADELLALFEADTRADGRIAVVRAPQQEVEERALTIVRDYGVRAMDAWHLACALIMLPELSEDDELRAFVSRDKDQATAARALGLVLPGEHTPSPETP